MEGERFELNNEVNAGRMHNATPGTRVALESVIVPPSLSFKLKISRVNGRTSTDNLKIISERLDISEFFFFFFFLPLFYRSLFPINIGKQDEKFPDFELYFDISFSIHLFDSKNFQFLILFSEIFCEIL